jgi:hypothetical protein
VSPDVSQACGPPGISLRKESPDIRNGGSGSCRRPEAGSSNTSGLWVVRPCRYENFHPQGMRISQRKGRQKAGRRFTEFHGSSSVGIATAYWLDDPGVGVRVAAGSRPALGSTQPPIQWLPGDLSPGVKRQKREADHLPSTTAQVKKTWIYTSTPHTPSWRSA